MEELKKPMAAAAFPASFDTDSASRAEQPANAAPLPLLGLKVLDLSRVLAGPFCCSMSGRAGVTKTGTGVDCGRARASIT